MKKGNYRWWIALLLFLATCINYLDRQLIGLLKPFLEMEFGWSERDFSRIVMAFTAAYAVGLLVSGRLMDRIGTRIGYLGSVALWSIASVVHALASSVGGFISARILLGLGESGNFPAGMKAISEWFPARERGTATGLFNAGTAVGVVGALFMTPYIMARHGWQGVFWVTGILGLVWMALWYRYYEVPERQKRLSEQERRFLLEGRGTGEEAVASKADLRMLLNNRHTWAYIAGKFFIDPIFWFFLFWLPSYFATSFRIDLSKPSPELIIVYASTTIGSIFGGYLSSRLVARGWKALRARKAVLLVFALVELSIIGARYVSDVWMAVALISVAVAVHQAWATNVFTLATDLFPKETVSSVVGIGGMAGSIGGILFPLFVGELLDRFKSAGDLQGGYNLIFTICGCAYLLAWACIHLLTSRRKRNEV